MTTLLTWQGQDVHLFPWDTTDSIIYRIAEKEKVPPTYLVVEEDFAKLIGELSWGENDVDIPITVRNLTREWEGSDIITTLKNMEKEQQELYVRFKTEQGEIDEQLWDTLFRHDFQDMSFQEWQDKWKEVRTGENQKKKQASCVSKLYLELSTEEQKQIVGWKSEKHRVLIHLADVRSLTSLFAGLRLGKEWKLSVLCQKTFQWGEKEKWVVKMRRQKDPSLDDLVQEVQENKPHMEEGIYLYHETMETPVHIQEDGKGFYRIGLETSDEHPDLVEKLLDALSVGTVQKQTDIGMVGGFLFPQLYVDLCIFQDMCMNDPVVSHFLYINELKKATYDNTLGVLLRQDIKDALGMETLKTYDFLLRNTHRQSGFQVHVSLHTPLSGKRLGTFFLLLRQIIGRYVRRRDRIVDDYSRFIPDFKKKLGSIQNSLVRNVKTVARPEYISKYPRMFVRNLYSVICQKNLQPILLKEEDTYDLPSDSYIRFPPQPIAEINPEYYYCPNKDYPYAGLKEMDLKGKDIFINMAPCCFNSPQDKENERKLSKLRTKDEEDAEDMEKGVAVSKTNIISGKFLIKYPGQLGTIRPPSMVRFFMAYDPFAEYFRVGVEQSPSSLIACMLMRRTMMGVHTPYHATEVRVKIAGDMDCVNACLQENPGLTADEIQSDMANPNVYFDPRRFYRALELYFGVRVLVFSKGPDLVREDADLLSPFSMRTHYTNHSDLPFTIVLEHWGGKTNLLSKFKHPHCELIGFKTPTESDMRFGFQPKGIFQLLDYVFYPFDGDRHILPFYRKECWFFRHITGQTTDPLGKVRWLHFQYYNQNFYAEIYPPIAIQDDVAVGDLPREVPVVQARSILKFLGKFDRWETVHVPDPEDNVVYWTVSQDHVLWKSLEENARLRLTFVCRLEKPQPDKIRDRGGRLQELILTETPDRMIHKTPTPPLHHHGKIANIISQLCVSGFSFFLKENGVRQGTADMDVLLQTFSQYKLRVDPSFIYPTSIQYDKEDYKGFLTGAKIVLPSQRFLEKILFHLKWLLFYQPQYIFDPVKTLVDPFQDIADFSTADPTHYYCDLSEVGNVGKYSVEDLYELSSVPIGELPQVCKERKDLYVLWYNKDQSPYPHPSIVMFYNTPDKTREAVRVWREEHRVMPDAMLSNVAHPEDPPSVYDFSPEETLWKKPATTDRAVEAMFRAQTDKGWLLFFPVSSHEN